MPGKSDRFRADLLNAVEELLKQTNFEDRTENEMDAYLNRMIEDMTHDFDRFARSGVPGVPHKGVIEHEKRVKEERIKGAIISQVSHLNLDNFDERKVRDIRDDMVHVIVRVMGRLGVQPAVGFMGETAEDMIEMLHKNDWLIQQALVTLSNYSLSDLTSSEVRELHVEVENILKGLPN